MLTRIALGTFAALIVIGIVGGIAVDTRQQRGRQPGPFGKMIEYLAIGVLGLCACLGVLVAAAVLVGLVVAIVSAVLP